MKRPLLAALLLVGLSLPACATLQELLGAAGNVFQRPTFTFHKASLSDASLSGISIDTVWDLRNPNALGLSLADIQYAFFVEDKQVVAGHPNKGLTIGANATSQLHFPAAFKFQDVVAVVQTFLNKDQAAWRAQGSIGVQTPIGLLNLPLQKNGSFEVPKVPALNFGNPKVTNVSLAGATVEFPLNVTNKNTYALPIGNVTGNLLVAGGNVGSISTGNLGDMSGKGTKTVNLPLTINFIGAAGAVVNAIRGGQANVALNAQVQSGSTAIPLNVNQTLTFTR